MVQYLHVFVNIEKFICKKGAYIRYNKQKGCLMRKIVSANLPYLLDIFGVLL